MTYRYFRVLYEEEATFDDNGITMAFNLFSGWESEKTSLLQA
jgi:hypothetical protein